jgi:hypothetical protein
MVDSKTLQNFILDEYFYQLGDPPTKTMPISSIVVKTLTSCKSYILE